jgi:hypothetical protein
MIVERPSRLLSLGKSGGGHTPPTPKQIYIEKGQISSTKLSHIQCRVIRFHSQQGVLPLSNTHNLRLIFAFSFQN